MENQCKHLILIFNIKANIVIRRYNQKIIKRKLFRSIFDALEKIMQVLVSLIVFNVFKIATIQFRSVFKFRHNILKIVNANLRVINYVSYNKEAHISNVFILIRIGIIKWVYKAKGVNKNYSLK